MKRINNKPVLRRKDTQGIDLTSAPEVKRNGKQHKNDPKGLLDDEAYRMVYEMALLRLTDNEIAGVLNVHPTTFQNWKRNNDDFAEVIRMGRQQADGKVAKTMLQRALGYDYIEEHHIEGVSANGQPYNYTRTIKKHAPPDVTAQIFWLKNRQRDNWADVNRIEANSNVTINIKKLDGLQDLSDQEKKLIRSISLKQLSDPNDVPRN
jgi:hypothetical protein